MQTKMMNVTGMTYGGCVSKMTEAQTVVPAFGHVDVSLPHKATIDFDKKLTLIEYQQSAVKGASYGV